MAAASAPFWRSRDIAFQVIVVDDQLRRPHRRNRPAGRAGIRRSIRCCLRVIVIEARRPLPAGWTGKANALCSAVPLARGDWLLFTDADTEHAPGSLAAAVQEAEQHGADLLSLSPEQQVEGFWERALMPVIFSELAVTFRPRDVSDPAKPVAAANGQYLLIRRGVYQEVGGHAAVAGDLLEDVALARRVKAAGHVLRFRMGKGMVRTRMYRGLRQMREGWTKNLALLFPDASSLACRRLAEFAALVALPPATASAWLCKSGPGSLCAPGGLSRSLGKFSAAHAQSAFRPAFHRRWRFADCRCLPVCCFARPGRIGRAGWSGKDATIAFRRHLPK